MSVIRKAILTSVGLGILGVALAETDPRPAQRQGPQQQALQACINKALGTHCIFTGRHGEITGQCVQTPRGHTTCRPERRRQQRDIARGQQQQRPQSNNRQQPGHSHSITTSSTLQLLPANASPIADNKVTINTQGNMRTIVANGVAAHNTGAFPNAHNPHAIEEQRSRYRVPLNPQRATQSTPVKAGQFGIAINGVLIEPATAEVYKQAREWRYEALSGAIPLGIDTNYAHVQPGGKYHYHGLPTGLLQSLGLNQRQHSPLIGWAADGFPIYALFGYKNRQNAVSGIQREFSSYRLKGGQRPGGQLPTGTPDGTFAQDYQYVAGAGTLDECNGKITVTPDYPRGTYAYFITDTFPVIPRCLKGTPSSDFSIR